MRFTRLQYAKLAYQNFHIPKKFHGASRIIGGTENRKLTQSFDMGCRLMCGFEAMYQGEKSETSSNSNQNEVNLKNKIQSKIYYSSKHKKDCNLCTIIDSIVENKNKLQITVLPHPWIGGERYPNFLIFFQCAQAPLVSCGPWTRDSSHPLQVLRILF